MVVQYKCLCMNITVDLVEEPSTVSDTTNLVWLKKTNWKSVFKGKLSLGGVRTVQPVLVKTKVLTEGYTMSTCVNCACEIFVNDAKNSQYYLNNIPQKPLDERLKDLGHHTYSKVFNLVLKEDEEASKSLLEAPDESDVEAFQIFSALQTQLKAALAEENRLMEQRIEAFKQEQQEALKQFQTKTYHDRKLLWHRVSEVMSKPSTPSFSNRHRSESPIPPKPVNLTPVTSPKLDSPILTNKNLVIIEDYEVSDQPKTERRPTAPPELRIPLVLPELQSSSEGPAMFEFDEEAESREKNKENQPKKEEEEEKPEETFEEPEFENYKARPVMKVSTDLFGTSLPVSIPRQQAVASTFHPRTALQKEKDNKDKSLKPPPIFSQEIVGSSEDEDEISKSFEVPLSLNSTLYRRLKTEL